jgi:hypothetical protein
MIKQAVLELVREETKMLNSVKKLPAFIEGFEKCQNITINNAVANTLFVLILSEGILQCDLWTQYYTNLAHVYPESDYMFMRDFKDVVLGIETFFDELNSVPPVTGAGDLNTYIVKKTSKSVSFMPTKEKTEEGATNGFYDRTLKRIGEERRPRTVPICLDNESKRDDRPVYPKQINDETNDNVIDTPPIYYFKSLMNVVAKLKGNPITKTNLIFLLLILLGSRIMMVGTDEEPPIIRPPENKNQGGEDGGKSVMINPVYLPTVYSNLPAFIREYGEFESLKVFLPVKDKDYEVYPVFTESGIIVLHIRITSETDKWFQVSVRLNDNSQGHDDFTYDTKTKELKRGSRKWSGGNEEQCFDIVSEIINFIVAANHHLRGSNTPETPGVTSKYIIKPFFKWVSNILEPRIKTIPISTFQDLCRKPEFEHFSVNDTCKLIQKKGFDSTAALYDVESGTGLTLPVVKTASRTVSIVNYHGSAYLVKRSVLEVEGENKLETTILPLDDSWRECSRATFDGSGNLPQFCRYWFDKDSLSQPIFDQQTGEKIGVWEIKPPLNKDAHVLDFQRVLNTSIESFSGKLYKIDGALIPHYTLTTSDAQKYQTPQQFVLGAKYTMVPIDQSGIVYIFHPRSRVFPPDQHHTAMTVGAVTTDSSLSEAYSQSEKTVDSNLQLAFKQGFVIYDNKNEEYIPIVEIDFENKKLISTEVYVLRLRDKQVFRLSTMNEVLDDDFNVHMFTDYKQPVTLKSYTPVGLLGTMFQLNVLQWGKDVGEQDLIYEGQKPLYILKQSPTYRSLSINPKIVKSLKTCTTMFDIQNQTNLLSQPVSLSSLEAEVLHNWNKLQANGNNVAFISTDIGKNLRQGLQQEDITQESSLNQTYFSNTGFITRHYGPFNNFTEYRRLGASFLLVMESILPPLANLWYEKETDTVTLQHHSETTITTDERLVDDLFDRINTFSQTYDVKILLDSEDIIWVKNTPFIGTLHDLGNFSVARASIAEFLNTFSVDIPELACILNFIGGTRYHYVLK